MVCDPPPELLNETPVLGSLPLKLGLEPFCQALVPSPVPLDPIPNPKQIQIQVQLGLG